VAPDDGDPDCALLTLVDPRQRVRGLYNVAQQALVLVRPDGYVGFRSSPANPAALHTYLDHTVGLRSQRATVTHRADGQTQPCSAST
jgi:hypothetical protein